MSAKKFLAFASMMVLAAAIGCSQSAEKAAPAAKTAATESSSHAGWWCVEHGVPEGVCARCDAKLVTDFKAKGDWCSDHDRPESQWPRPGARPTNSITLRATLSRSSVTTTADLIDNKGRMSARGDVRGKVFNGPGYGGGLNIMNLDGLPYAS